eukprot:jgi/Chrzof1/13001/Cz07g16010.t1
MWAPCRQRLAQADSTNLRMVQGEVAGAAAGAGPSSSRLPVSSGGPATATINSEVIDLVDADSDDDGVQVIGVKPGSRPPSRPTAVKRHREVVASSKPALSFHQPPPAPRPPSPEPGYKCPICLEAIDQMATTPCGRSRGIKHDSAPFVQSTPSSFFVFRYYTWNRRNPAEPLKHYFTDVTSRLHAGRSLSALLIIGNSFF